MDPRFQLRVHGAVLLEDDGCVANMVWGAGTGGGDGDVEEVGFRGEEVQEAGEEGRLVRVYGCRCRFGS